MKKLLIKNFLWFNILIKKKKKKFNINEAVTTTIF